MAILRALLRSLLGMGQVVGREAAVAAAKDECLKQGWPWVEPVHVLEGPIEYLIMTSAHMRGGNVSVRIRCEDGRVVAAGFAPH
jgi:hypothetical protein